MAIRINMKPVARRAYLIASGDQRQSANETCWPEQAKMEAALTAAFRAEGWKLVRGYPVDKQKRHGFIDSQRRGIEIFRTLDPEAPLVVAEAVWQYSHHVLAGLTTHRGPILTVANWSGNWRRSGTNWRPRGIFSCPSFRRTCRRSPAWILRPAIFR